MAGMHRRRALATIALGLAAPGLARARAPAKSPGFTLNHRRIDAALQQTVTAGRAAGTSALIWQNGAERYFGAAGDADREAHRPMQRNTLVQIFSMTKPVTGVR